MTGMKHALNGNMALYEKDARETREPWERWRRNHGNGWAKCHMPPAWSPGTQYERIPQTIRIGDMEVPAPYRGPMEIKQAYWVISLSLPEKAIIFHWGGDASDRHHMARGVLHLTEAAALETADALLAQLGVSDESRHD